MKEIGSATRSRTRPGPSLNILIKLISMVAVATIGITLSINNGQGLVKMVMEMLLR